MRNIALILILCGLICTSSSTRMKYDRGFPEPVHRGEANIMPEAVFKREPFYQRESMLQGEPIIPQQILRPIYGGEATISIKPALYAQEQYVPTQQLQAFAGEQIMPSEQYIRSEPVISRENIIRREPMMRPQPMIRAEPMYQNSPVIRENSMYGNEATPYAVMMTPCSCFSCSGCSACSECSSCSQSHHYSSPSSQPQENYYQVQPQPIFSQQSMLQQQPMIQQQPVLSQPTILSQHFLPPRVTYQKFKPAVVHSYVTIPRVQRFVRKSYRPITDNIQITTVPLQNASDMTSFPMTQSEPVQYSNNANTFQSQSQVQDHTPEPQTTPSTTRNTSNRFPIPPVSSIC